MPDLFSISGDMARLPVISAQGLLDNKSTENDVLFAAARDVGFFYLDYRGTSIEQTRKLFDVTEELMALPAEEKMRFDNVQRGVERMDGYRLAGISNGPFAGKRDGFESYMIPANSLFNLQGAKTYDHPDPLQRHRKLIEQCVRDLNSLGLQILTALSTSLGLSGGDAMQAQHRVGQLSTSALGLLKYLPEGPEADKVGHYAHTDIGTLSFVFSEVGGLQVLLPGSEDWQFVQPRDGHAIVNVGDSLTFLSSGKLRSILHRVVPQPGEHKTKLTTGYFLRPEFNARMTDREGREWTSHEWHTNKFRLFRAPKEEQEQNSYVTGRHGYLGIDQPREVGEVIAR